MKILIANRDRTEELVRRFQAAAATRPDRLHREGRMPEITALRLAEARTEEEFLTRFIEHLRLQHGRFAEGYEEIAVRPGAAGRLRALARAAVDRATRGQQERALARQGLLTELLIAAMEFQQVHFREAAARIEERLAALEERVQERDDGERPA